MHPCGDAKRRISYLFCIHRKVILKIFFASCDRFAGFADSNYIENSLNFDLFDFCDCQDESKEIIPITKITVRTNGNEL
jgi:hypothetical protein